jgi:hypothetical protein
MILSTIFGTVLRSAIFYDTQSFCNLDNHFATVNSGICYSAQLFLLQSRSFYDFVSHSRDPIRHFATTQSSYDFVSHSLDPVSHFVIVLIHFAKFLSHS